MRRACSCMYCSMVGMRQRGYGCEWSGLICQQRRYYSRLGNRPDCVVQEEGAIYYTFPPTLLLSYLLPRTYFQDIISKTIRLANQHVI